MRMTHDVIVHFLARLRSRQRDLAAMVRGLANRRGGFRSLSGQTDRRMLSGKPLRFRFASAEQAERFLRTVVRQFGQEVRVLLR